MNLAHDLRANFDLRVNFERKLSIWRARPDVFCKEVLGFEPWDHDDMDSQADVLRASATEKAITVRSGHKVGKSRLAAGRALYEYVCWPGSRTIVTAPTGRQVKEVVWREIRMLARNARMPLGGQLALDPGTGLRNHATDTQVMGFSTDDQDRFSGFSAERVTYIVDEASGVSDEIYQALEGNRAGGALIMLISNGTQPTGHFYDSHNSKRSFYKTFHISSEDVANAVARGEIPPIPGLAQKQWVDEKLKEWGRDSLEFQVRALGNFPSLSSDTIISLGSYNAARARRPPRCEHPDITEPLNVGLDVARFGDDESVLCARRGRYVFDPQGWKGLDGPGLASRVIVALTGIMHPAEGRHGGSQKPTIRVDVTGGTGASAYDALAHKYSDIVRAIPVGFAEKAIRSDKYVNKRSELWFQARDFVKICQMPDHQRLRDDLLAPRYSFDNKLRQLVEPKDNIKKRLGRSTDYGDAFILCCDASKPKAGHTVHIPGL